MLRLDSISHRSQDSGTSALCSQWPINLKLTHLDLNTETSLIHFQAHYLTTSDVDYSILQVEIQNTPKTKASVEVGEFCLVEDLISGRWYRGQVRNAKAVTFDVFLIDHGNILSVDISQMYSCSNDLFDLPPKVVCGFFANVLPLHDCWDSVMGKYLLSLIGKNVTGYIHALLPNQVLIFEATDINKELVGLGFGKHVDTDTFLLLVQMLTEVPLEQNMDCGPDLIQKPRGQNDLKSSCMKGLKEILSFCGTNISVGTCIQLKVTAAVNPGFFHCQMSSAASDIQAMSERLTAACQSTLSNPNWIPQDNLGLLCSVKGKDGKWYRGIVQCLPVNSQVQVLFVDYGFCESVGVENILRLPPNCLSMPIMAFPCSLSSVTEHNKDWKLRQLWLLKKGILTGVLNAKILSLDVKLNIYFIEILGNEECIVGEPELPQELSRWNHEAVFKGAQGLPQAGEFCGETVMAHVLRSSVQAEGFTTGSKCVGYVVHAINPNDFSLRTEKRNSDFEDLMKQMSEHFSQVKLNEQVLENPQVGTMCCAMYEHDMQFYRAIVKHKLAFGAVVLFIDFGNIEKVPYMLIKKIPEKFVSQAAFALSCTLGNITPITDVWASASIQFFKQAVSNRSLMVHVIHQTKDKIVVDLFTMTNENITELLIYSKQAEYWKLTTIATTTTTTTTTKALFLSVITPVSSKPKEVIKSKSFNSQQKHKRVSPTLNKTHSQGQDKRVSPTLNTTHSQGQDKRVSPTLNTTHSQGQDKRVSPTLKTTHSQGQDKRVSPTLNTTHSQGQDKRVSPTLNTTHSQGQDKRVSPTLKTTHSQGQDKRVSPTLNTTHSQGQDKRVSPTLNTTHSQGQDKRVSPTLNKTHSQGQDKRVSPTLKTTHSQGQDKRLSPAINTTKKHQISKMPTLSSLPNVRLKQGLKALCYASHINTVCDFFLQLQEDETNILNMREVLNSSVSRALIKSTPRELDINNHVLAEYEDDGALYRAVIKASEGNGFKVEFLDYGNLAVVRKDKIYSMSGGLILQPRLSIPCSLVNTSAYEKESTFRDAITDKPLRVEFVCRIGKQWKVKIEILEEMACLSVPVPDGAAEPTSEPTKQEVNDLNLSSIAMKAKLIKPSCLTKEVHKPQEVTVSTKDKILVPESSDRPTKSKMCLQEPETNASLKSCRTSDSSDVRRDIVDAFLSPAQALGIEQGVLLSVLQNGTFYVRLQKTGILLLTIESLIATYLNERDTLPNEQVIEGLKCVVKGPKDSWSRAVVVHVDKPKCKTFLLDHGLTTESTCCSLRKFHSDLAHISGLAVLCKLNNPSFVVTQFALESLRQLVCKDVTLRFVTHSDPDNLWLVEIALNKSIFQQAEITNSGQLSEDFNPISKETNIFKITTNYKDEHARLGSSLPQQLYFASINMGQVYYGFAAAVISPFDFYIVLEDSLLIMNEVSAMLKELPNEMPPLPEADLVPGSCCLVYSNTKGRWCRAEVVHAETTVAVNLVDYGHCEYLAYSSYQQVKILPEALKKLPKVTYPCSLRGVNQVSDKKQWTDEAAVFFQERVCYKDLQIVFWDFVSDDQQWEVDVLVNGIYLSKELVKAGHSSYRDVLLGLRFEDQHLGNVSPLMASRMDNSWQEMCTGCLMEC